MVIPMDGSALTVLVGIMRYQISCVASIPLGTRSEDTRACHARLRRRGGVLEQWSLHTLSR